MKNVLSATSLVILLVLVQRNRSAVTVAMASAISQRIAHNQTIQLASNVTKLAIGHVTARILQMIVVPAIYLATNATVLDTFPRTVQIQLKHAMAVVKVVT